MRHQLISWVGPSSRMDSYSDPDHSSQDQLEKTQGGTSAWQDALVRPRSVNRLSAVESILMRFSPAERFLLYILTVLLTGSVLFMVITVDKNVSVSIPAQGG